MSATLGVKSLKIEFAGKVVSVPNDNIARLMYYLSVVANVIQYKENNKFLEYNNYLQLNEEEKEEVYKLALLMKPEIFIEAGIFKVDPCLVP